MATEVWTNVEDAVLAALQAGLGSQVKTLIAYQGDWQTDLQQEYWRFPAVLVQLRQTRGEQVTLRSYDFSLEFTIFVAVRGNSAKHRDSREVYQILAGVREALWNQDLGLAVEPFNLMKEEPLLNNLEFSVYAAHYDTVLVQDM
jgi:phage gp37-like protein